MPGWRRCLQPADGMGWDEKEPVGWLVMQTFSPVLLISSPPAKFQHLSPRVCACGKFCDDRHLAESQLSPLWAKTPSSQAWNIVYPQHICFSSSKVLLLWSPFLYFPALLLYGFWKTISVLSLQQDLGREWKHVQISNCHLHPEVAKPSLSWKLMSKVRVEI